MDIERELTKLIERVDALEVAMTRGESRSESAGAATSAPPPPPAPGAIPYALVGASPSQSRAPLQVPPSQPFPGDGSGGQFGAGPPPVSATSSRWDASSFEFGIESILRWAGVALVTLAGIFLVSTAISRGWIGPELQLLGAALGGVALLVAALKFAETLRQWSLAFGSGGAIVLAASALATHEWLDLVGPGVAIGLLVVATAASIGVAVRIRMEGIALVAAVVGMFAALETVDRFGQTALLGWVAAFVIFSSVLGALKQWPGLRVITGWLGAFLLAGYALSEEVDGALRVAGLIGAAVIACTLWAGPTIASRLSAKSGSGNWGVFDWTPVDYRLVALVPGWVWLVVGGLLPITETEDFGLVAIAVAVGFAGLASAPLRQVHRLVLLSTLFGSMALLAVGFATYLDGPALMVALGGQAVTSYFLGRKLDDIPMVYAGYLVGAASSGLALYEMLDALDHGGFENLGYGFATALVVLLWVSAGVYAYFRHDSEIPFEAPFIGAWIGCMLWSAAVLTGVPQGLGQISAVWALMACVGLVVGLKSRISIIRNVGLLTLGATLVKLVTVDMAEIEVFWRVGLFFVVGMGLIALGLKLPSLLNIEVDSPDSRNTEVPS